MKTLTKGTDMEALQEQVALSFKDIKSNPGQLIKLLSGDKNVSLMIRRQANTVRVFKRVYPDEVQEILEEAKAKLAAEKKAGFTKEQKFENFDAALKKVSAHLKKTEHAKPA